MRSNGKTEPSGIASYYRKFWDEVLRRMREQRLITGSQQTPSKSFLYIRAAKPGYKHYIAFTRDKTFRVELYIDQGDPLTNNRLFEYLKSHRDDIEEQMGVSLSWQRLDAKRACRIAVERPVYDHHAQREEFIKWGIQMFVKLREVLTPWLK